MSGDISKIRLTQQQQTLSNTQTNAYTQTDTHSPSNSPKCSLQNNSMRINNSMETKKFQNSYIPINKISDQTTTTKKCLQKQNK